MTATVRALKPCESPRTPTTAAAARFQATKFPRHGLSTSTESAPCSRSSRPSNPGIELFTKSVFTVLTSVLVWCIIINNFKNNRQFFHCHKLPQFYQGEGCFALISQSILNFSPYFLSNISKRPVDDRLFCCCFSFSTFCNLSCRMFNQTGFRL